MARRSLKGFTQALKKQIADAETVVKDRERDLDEAKRRVDALRGVLDTLTDTSTKTEVQHG